MSLVKVIAWQSVFRVKILSPLDTGFSMRSTMPDIVTTIIYLNKIVLSDLFRRFSSDSELSQVTFPVKLLGNSQSDFTVTACIIDRFPII